MRAAQSTEWLQISKVAMQMDVELMEIESKVLGAPALAISGLDAAADFTALEREYVEAYDPYYVSCKLPLEDVPAIHLLETRGFHLVECQIKAAIRFRRPFEISGGDAYRFEKITSASSLEAVLELAATSFEHDRFTMDPALPKDSSGERYRLYTLKSYSDSAEAVYGLLDAESGNTLAFKTCRTISPIEVQLFLSGVHPAMKNLGLGPVSNFFFFNELMRQGVRKAHGYISAHNYNASNMDFGLMGFRAVGAFAVLRKIYT
jgi:hypothetical protein